MLGGGCHRSPSVGYVEVMHNGVVALGVDLEDNSACPGFISPGDSRAVELPVVGGHEPGKGRDTVWRVGRVELAQQGELLAGRVELEHHSALARSAAGCGAV